MGVLWIRVPGSEPLLWHNPLFWRGRFITLARPSDLVKVWSMLSPELQAALIEVGLTSEKATDMLVTCYFGGRQKAYRAAQEPNGGGPAA